MAAMRHGYPVSAAMMFVIAVLINGAGGGLTQGLCAALLSSAVYSFFIRFPVYSIGLHAIDDFVPIIALALTAILTGVLSGRLKDRAQAAERAQAQLSHLLRFSSDLQSAIDLNGVIGALAAATPDRQRLAALLAQLARDGAPRDQAGWNAATAQYLDRAASAPADDAPPAHGPPQPTGDERAIISLSRLAMDRSELLQEQATAEAAVKSEALKSALLSSLSHDLLTPLAAIAASATSLRRFGSMLDDTSRAEMLVTIEEQCARLENFAGKLISLGRIEGGLALEDLEIVDLGEAVASTVARVRTIAPDRPFSCAIPDDAILALTHPALFDQVLSNVLENAVRYSHRPDEVALSLSADDGQAEILITDSGPGISPDDLKNVFTRFYRGRNAAGTPGHGLGLSIAKTFLENLGGSIALISPVAKGKGTQVRITVPVAQGAHAEAEAETDIG